MFGVLFLTPPLPVYLHWGEVSREAAGLPNLAPAGRCLPAAVREPAPVRATAENTQPNLTRRGPTAFLSLSFASGPSQILHKLFQRGAEHPAGASRHPDSGYLSRTDDGSSLTADRRCLFSCNSCHFSSAEAGLRFAGASVRRVCSRWVLTASCRSLASRSLGTAAFPPHPP